MPDVEFAVNTDTGEFIMHIEGIAGSACEDVANLVKDLAGEPDREEQTAEYVLRPRVTRQVDSRIRTARS